MIKKEIIKNNLLIKLRSYVPEFKDIEKEEAIDETVGEHYIMGALKDLTERLVKANNIKLIKKVLIFLEKAWMEGEYDIHNAVMVSFFQDLSDKAFSTIKPHLSPILLEESEHYRNQWMKFRRSRGLKNKLTSKNIYFNKKEIREIKEKIERMKERNKYD